MQLLRVNCVGCHNAEKRKGGLVLDSREAVLKGGDSGPAATEGKPEDSLLVQSLQPGAESHMPPKKQLSAAQMKVLSDWVQNGMPWDAAALSGQGGTPREVSLAPPPAAYRPVLALALSPDGTRLAVGCRNEVLWFRVDAAGLILSGKTSAHPDPVQSLAWTPDGARLISGSFRRVVLWKADLMRQELEVAGGLTGGIGAIKVLPDSKTAIIADGTTAESGIVRVLDLAEGRMVRSWAAHEDTIPAMSLSTDGTRLVTAGGDRMVKVWELPGGAAVSKIEAHGTQVLAAGFSPDNTQLVTGGADRQLKVWDLKTGENTIALSMKSSAFNAVQWSPAGPAVLAVTEDGSVLKYSGLKVHTGAQSSESADEKQLAHVDSALFCLAVNTAGDRVFAGTGDGHLLVWNETGKLTDNIDLAQVRPIPPVAP
ncbi:MAG: domain, G-beta repeat [Verrucomicrobiales bacterium]|nr:domain, G-beta repeat [Verrucomicrobiales bacterium]